MKRLGCGVATITVTTFWLEISEPDRIKDDAKNAAFTFDGTMEGDGEGQVGRVDGGLASHIHCMNCTMNAQFDIMFIVSPKQSNEHLHIVLSSRIRTAPYMLR